MLRILFIFSFIVLAPSYGVDRCRDEFANPDPFAEPAPVDPTSAELSELGLSLKKSGIAVADWLWLEEIGSQWAFGVGRLIRVLDSVDRYLPDIQTRIARIRKDKDSQTLHDIKNFVQQASLAFETLCTLYETQLTMFREERARFRDLYDQTTVDQANRKEIRRIARQFVAGTAEAVALINRELSGDTDSLKRSSTSASRIAERLYALVGTVPPKAPEFSLMADTDSLVRATSNLISNARDAGATTVTLSLREQNFESVKAQSRNGYRLVPSINARTGIHVGIVITDNGEGMKDAALSTLFSGQSTRAQGTGQGMPAVQDCIAGHNGFIEVRSEQGSGTTITMWLPVYAEAAPVTSSPTVSSSSEPLLYLVDDEPDQRQMLGMLAKLNAYRVESFATRKEALAACKIEMPRLVVTDLNTGEGDVGLNAIKTAHPTLPVLVLSGNEPSTTQGFDASLIKPLNMEAFFQTVERLLKAE